MARGDVKWFAAYFRTSQAGIGFNFASDTFKLGLVTNAIVPAVGTDDPRWGTGGSTNFSSSQVATGSSYTGPITLSSVTYTRTGGVVKFDAADIVVAADATGFTNAYSAIIYDDTVSGKYCIAYIDLGGPVSIQVVPMNINFHTGGILTDAGV